LLSKEYYRICYDKNSRYGAYVREVSLKQQQISFNQIAPSIEKDAQGNDLPYHPPKIQLRSLDIVRLIKPYISVRLNEQIKAVVPLAIYLALFQLFILKQNISDHWVITAGMISVIVGLMLFMEGLKVGLMPFGETIGTVLPSKSSLPVVLFIAFLLGIGVTFAEPAIGALKAAGSIVNVTEAPYLYALLNDFSGMLVLIVGMGVGLAAVVGTLRFLYSWSMKPVIYCTLIPTLALTIYVMGNPFLSNVLGLAWDSGAVTTGPVTVPLVLSLGIGIASSAGKGSSSLSGFGIVTLASLFPIMGVLGLAIFIYMTVPAADIIANAAMAAEVSAPAWHEVTPWLEIKLGIQAIVPLVLFLLAVLTLVLKEQVKNKLNTFYGIFLCVLGMVIFNVGLSYGLAKLGGQSGGLVPAAFTFIDFVEDSPLYSYGFGIFIALLFAWLLGFGATLAEPALNALGSTVENLTNGAFKKSMLMYSVGIGVACGISLGILKLVLNIPVVLILLPFYFLAIFLTYISTEDFVNIAWDSAGVTTGPVTVPLVLAMGLGFGNAMGSLDGFGILSLASICPILAVLLTGIWVQWKIRRRHKKSESEMSQLDVGVAAI
jgi:hypothetical protein